MKTENRPYSAQNVFDNLRKRGEKISRSKPIELAHLSVVCKVNKTMCGKILDKLSDDNTLVRKEYGKNKIYSVNQVRCVVYYLPSYLEAHSNLATSQ
jgi:predicted transcriptional regulator